MGVYSFGIDIREGESVMGRLLLCCNSQASTPYYMASAALHIYSIEELCYYIRENIDLLELSFMEDGLIAWIETELGMGSLAGRLWNVKSEDRGLTAFVNVILSSCNYCSREEASSLEEMLEGFADKSETQRKKMRLDRLLLKKRYRACILGYESLLKEPELPDSFAGDVFHNLGTAYARLFYFQKAAECYQKAYNKNHHPLSLEQCEKALRLAQGELPEAAEEENQIDARMFEQWKESYKKSCE